MAQLGLAVFPLDYVCQCGQRFHLRGSAQALHVKPPRILRDLLLALTYIVVAITILSRDIDLTGIVATSAVITAVIGLSFQDTLGNMMGGMALQLERTIGVGDWIKLDGYEGLVKEIRWRHTSIETRNWDTIVIPNSVLMKSQVTVLGRRQGRARDSVKPGVERNPGLATPN